MSVINEGQKTCKFDLFATTIAKNVLSHFDQINSSVNYVGKYLSAAKHFIHMTVNIRKVLNT